LEPVGFIWAALGPNLMYIGTVWATKGDALVLLASAPQGEAIGGQDGLGWGQQESAHSLIEEPGLERTTAVRSRPKDSSLCHHCSTTVAVNNFLFISTASQLQRSALEVQHHCFPITAACKQKLIHGKNGLSLTVSVFNTGSLTAKETWGISGCGVLASLCWLAWLDRLAGPFVLVCTCSRLWHGS